MTKTTLSKTSNKLKKIRPKRKPALLSPTNKRREKTMRRTKSMLTRRTMMTRRTLSTNLTSLSRSLRASLASIYSLLLLASFLMNI